MVWQQKITDYARNYSEAFPPAVTNIQNAFISHVTQHIKLVVDAPGWLPIQAKIIEQRLQLRCCSKNNNIYLRDKTFLILSNEVADRNLIGFDDYLKVGRAYADFWVDHPVIRTSYPMD